MSDTLSSFYGILRELESREARRSFWYFCNVVNGAQWFNRGRSLMDWHHHELCDQLQELWETRHTRIKTQMYVEWPRGTLKSTISSEDFPMWVALQDSNTRICLESATMEKSSDLLVSIKGKFEADYIAYLFGKLYNPRERWSQDELMLKRSGSFKEPTIMASGLEAGKTGRHYDLIIPDDLIGQENSETQEQIDKAKRRFRDYGSLLNPNGMILVVGTVWGPDDLGAEIEEQNKRAIKRGINKPWVSASFRDYKEGDRTKGVEFPTLLPQEKLDAELSQQGEYLYGCNYGMERRSDKTATFKWECLREHDYNYRSLGQDPFSTWNCYITIDPGKGGTSENADDVAITVVVVTADFGVYAMESICEKLSDLQTIEKVFELNDLWKPDAVGFEAVFQQNTAFLELKRRAETEGKALPLRKFKTSQRNKAMRIRALAPIVESGRLFVKQDQTKLREQLFRYRGDGSLKHEDALDSLAYVVEFLDAAASQKKEGQFDDPDWLTKWDVEAQGKPPDPQDITWMKIELANRRRLIGRRATPLSRMGR